MLLVGQISSGTCRSARYSTRVGSSIARTPWPSRSAPSVRKAPQILIGPTVSPAWGALRSPVSRAFSNQVTYCSGGWCTSPPPSPRATTPSSLPSWATASVYSARLRLRSASGISRTISKIHLISTPNAARARWHPFVNPAKNVSNGTPKEK